MPSGRQYQWFSILDENDTALASGNQVEKDLLSGMSTDDRKGSTITRVIVDLVITADTLNQKTFTSYGLCMVNLDAFAAGAVPDADSNVDRADWLLRGRSRNYMTQLSGTSDAFVRSYDLRAQRVLRSEEMTLALILDHGSGGGINFFWMSRILVKLR